MKPLDDTKVNKTTNSVDVSSSKVNLIDDTKDDLDDKIDSFLYPIYASGIVSKKTAAMMLRKMMIEYGLQECIDSEYQTRIKKIVTNSNGTEVWGVRISYDTEVIYSDIATSEGMAKEKLDYQLAALKEHSFKEKA